MLTARLRERVPSATAIGIGQLVGHALRWDKRSWQDGSGKCDAEATSRSDDVVWGVLFEVEPEDKPALDKAEGVGAGYLEETVNVLTEGIATVPPLTFRPLLPDKICVTVNSPPPPPSL